MTQHEIAKNLMVYPKLLLFVLFLCFHAFQSLHPSTHFLTVPEPRLSFFVATNSSLLLSIISFHEQNTSIAIADQYSDVILTTSFITVSPDTSFCFESSGSLAIVNTSVAFPYNHAPSSFTLTSFTSNKGKCTIDNSYFSGIHLTSNSGFFSSGTGNTERIIGSSFVNCSVSHTSSNISRQGPSNCSYVIESQIIGSAFECSRNIFYNGLTRALSGTLKQIMNNSTFKHCIKDRFEYVLPGLQSAAFSDLTFVDLHSPDFGGAICFVFHYDLFYSLAVDRPFDQEAYCLSPVSTSFLRCKFVNCSAVFGGAIGLSSAKSVHISSCAFDTCWSEVGGAICIQGYYAPTFLTIQSTNFTRCNTSYNPGGALTFGMLPSCVYEVEESVSSPYSITISDCVATSCKTASYGVVFKLPLTDTWMSSCLFNGESIYSTQGSLLHISQDTVPVSYSHLHLSYCVFIRASKEFLLII